MEALLLEIVWDFGEIVYFEELNQVVIDLKTIPELIAGNCDSNQFKFLGLAVRTFGLSQEASNLKFNSVGGF